MKPVPQAPEPADRLSTLSVRDLIAELVQVEDTLHRLPALLAEAESVVPRLPGRCSSGSTPSWTSSPHADTSED